MIFSVLMNFLSKGLNPLLGNPAILQPTVHHHGLQVILINLNLKLSGSFDKQKHTQHGDLPVELDLGVQGQHRILEPFVVGLVASVHAVLDLDQFGEGECGAAYEAEHVNYLSLVIII